MKFKLRFERKYHKFTNDCSWEEENSELLNENRRYENANSDDLQLCVSCNH
jgi:hypothetical protein